MQVYWVVFISEWLILKDFWRHRTMSEVDLLI